MKRGDSSTPRESTPRERAQAAALAVLLHTLFDDVGPQRTKAVQETVAEHGGHLMIDVMNTWCYIIACDENSEDLFDELAVSLGGPETSSPDLIMAAGLGMEPARALVTATLHEGRPSSSRRDTSVYRDLFDQAPLTLIATATILEVAAHCTIVMQGPDAVSKFVDGAVKYVLATLGEEALPEPLW